MLTAKEGWLIGERPLPGEPSSAENKEGEEELNYYYSTLLVAESFLGAAGSLAKSRWTIEQFYEDAKGSAAFLTTRAGGGRGLHRHLALSMLAYSFLMLHSSVRTSTDSSSEVFSPPVRHTTLPAIHRQVMVWLLEDLVLWFIETDRIKTFRPRRN